MRFTALFRTYINVAVLPLCRAINLNRLASLFFRAETKAKAHLWRYPRHKFDELQRLLLGFILGVKLGRLGLFMRFFVHLFRSYRRRQGGLLRLYKKLFSSMFRLRNLLGLCFMLRGKLNRRPRSREFEFTLGRPLPLQNLNLNIVYAGRQLITDFGVYSFRL